MKWKIEAACSTDVGKVRRNNEDNFYFDGQCLALDHDGLSEPMGLNKQKLKGTFLAVFDGMGGENYGEDASYAAAAQMQKKPRTLAERFASDKDYLYDLTERLNEAVMVYKRARQTNRMGTTMVALYFSGKYAYVCNAGDSRAYRLRNGEIQQISWDHVERIPGRETRKAPLTQHLGMDPNEALIEPYIARFQLEKGDRYLLCSDGLTDMLTDRVIAEIMCAQEASDACVQALIQAALDAGGRDNVTAIVCKLW